jgi:hypothetical protein
MISVKRFILKKIVFYGCGGGMRSAGGKADFSCKRGDEVHFLGKKRFWK